MKTAFRETIQTVALAIFVFLVLQSTLQNYRVEGSSMNPSLQDHQLVLVNKLVYINVEAERLARLLPWVDGKDGESWHLFHAPRQGDVIIFQAPIPPFDDFVKRVIGVPGDTVVISNGVVFVNDQVLDEPYVVNNFPERRAAVTVGQGEYYVLGDNRGRSDDSRHWGMVPEENIVGKAWIGYWPLDRFNFLAIGIGFALLNVGTIGGMIGVGVWFGRWWTGDPTEYVTALLWVSYLALWLTRLRATLRGRRVALLSILGFSLAVFTLVGISGLLPSWHPDL